MAYRRRRGRIRGFRRGRSGRSFGKRRGGFSRRRFGFRM